MGLLSPFAVLLVFWSCVLVPCSARPPAAAVSRGLQADPKTAYAYQKLKEMIRDIVKSEEIRNFVEDTENRPMTFPTTAADSRLGSYYGGGADGGMMGSNLQYENSSVESQLRYPPTKKSPQVYYFYVKEK